MDTQINELTNQNSIKLLAQQMRKRYYKTLGTRVINIPTSSPSINIWTFLISFYATKKYKQIIICNCIEEKTRINVINKVK